MSVSKANAIYQFHLFFQIFLFSLYKNEKYIGRRRRMKDVLVIGLGFLVFVFIGLGIGLC